MASYPPWMGGAERGLRGAMQPQPLRAPGVAPVAGPVGPRPTVGGLAPGLDQGLTAFREWNRPPGGAIKQFGGVMGGAGPQRPPGLGDFYSRDQLGGFPMPQPAQLAETPRQRSERQAGQKAKRAGASAPAPKSLTPGARPRSTPPNLNQPVGNPRPAPPPVIGNEDVFGPYGAGYGG